jgi:GTP-binding protein
MLHCNMSRNALHAPQIFRKFEMNLRNVAIIAHVDHGKTTLVDQLFRQSGHLPRQPARRGAGDGFERPREGAGITILAKCTSVEWHGTHINIVDTPGHADFGAEVERILSMVDGVILLVDAAEGPDAADQVRHRQGAALGLRPIVVVNKIDRPDARPAEVLDEVFELFLNLDASDEQLDFPTLYASGRRGLCRPHRRHPRRRPYSAVRNHRQPCPRAAGRRRPVPHARHLLDRDPFLGRILTGRIESGRLDMNMPIKAIDVAGNVVEEGRATKIFAFRGLERVPVESAEAGEIVAIAGLIKATVSNTFADPEVTAPLHAREIDPPTLAMSFASTTAPSPARTATRCRAGSSASALLREAEGNVAIRVTETPGFRRF